MLVMILWFLYHMPLLQCPPKNLGQPAVSLLAVLMNCIPGFNTAQLKELLLKLQIPAVEEVLGLNMSEAVEVS